MHEEIKALITEGIFHHRWVLLQTYHQAGKLMFENNVLPEPTMSHRQKKDWHYALELYKKYPDLNSLPEGKNISWYKVCKTLPPYEKNQDKKSK